MFRTFIKPRGKDARIFQVKFKLTWMSQLNYYEYQLSYNTECALWDLLFKRFVSSIKEPGDVKLGFTIV